LLQLRLTAVSQHKFYESYNRYDVLNSGGIQIKEFCIRELFQCFSVRELDVRCAEQQFVNVTIFVFFVFRANLLAVNHLFLLIVLCLWLNGIIETLLEIMTVVSSANSEALDKVLILEGRLVHLLRKTTALEMFPWGNSCFIIF
jgi:hypothetical protein